jgi:surface protein
MSIIGGQNTPTLNGLAYIIDFNNNYTSGSSTVNPILYLPTSSQFTGSVPNLINGQVQFTGSSVLRSFQNFPGFNPNTGNLTIMFSGEVKNNAVLFTQDAQMAVVATTSSIGYGVPAGNVGRNFPNVGFDHVTLRFSSASVDCFINGVPVSASGIFPTVPSSSVFTDFKIGGNHLTNWTGSLSGSLGQLMVYNRPLSDDEIYSNYLIQSRRYGLPEIAKPYTVDSSVYVYSQAAGITDTVTLNALNTFVQGLKSASLWDKMVAIYPFIGTNPSASRLNLKDVSLNTTQVNYSGSWSTSLSGSRNNNTSSFGVLSNITPSYVYPLINSQSFHMTYLSYDTPVSGGYAMGATTQVIATGGQVFDISGSRVHVFTASANFTVTQGGTVQALVVAGGGGGGGDIAGGGGAGGLIFTSLFATSSTYSVNVGGGGSGGSGGSATTGNNGGTSSFAGNVTLGGGGGGGFARSGSNGGSGGGHGVSSTTFGLGTAGQGNNGALATTPGGSGGGGASTSGSNITGGSGSFFPQYVGTGFGSPAGWFAGGGGGAPTDYTTLDGGLGGIGGGGQAGRRPVYNPTTGSTNTGGGGGGGSSNQNGGTGGSGIVIISYPISGSTTLYIDPTSISASINDTSTNNLVTGGPIGMITVSRTGSVGTILTKNKVPTIGTSRVSSSINLNLYLNVLNASNALVSASQNTVAYTSVGSGLTPTEISTYYDLVNNLQTSLGRGVSNPNAFITVWNTLLTGSGTSNSSSIVLPLFGTQAITASWGDGTVSLISSSTQVDRTHSYATPGIYTVSITGQGQGFRFNYGGDRNKLIDIGQWGSISGSTEDTFSGCANLVGTAPDPHVLQTTSLYGYFLEAFKFNGAIGNWNVSNITNMQNLFGSLSSVPMAFNQNIGSWNVSNVTNMQQTFAACTSFNQNLGSWNVSNVTNMQTMFGECSSFNQNIGSWNVSNTTNMQTMFFKAFAFNNGGSANINNWNTSNVTFMGRMFDQATSFNQNIGSWNVSKVTSMNSMFISATSFNNSGSSDINNWRPISCSNFANMFQSATSFNQPIGNWPLSASSINMSAMFRSSGFNQNIGSWDVSKVINMSSMFLGSSFNNSGSSDINNWRPISCSNFNSMFEGAASFNQPIGNWPLSASNIDMSLMFEGANSFNQDIGTWDVSRVINMGRMIRATNFNNGGSPSIGSWDTSNVTTMRGLFWDNNQFKQDIGAWNVGKVTDLVNFITYGGYPYLHSIYDGWINNKLQSRVTASFSTSKYSGSAAEGRALLTRTYNTSSITGYSNDGGFMAITCSANHSVIVGNKVFISGSSFSGVNGVETVLVAGSPTTLTLNTVYDPTATGGTIFTGYGWSITDGGVV